LKDNFHIGSTIQHATFELVHQLFSKYGLIILIADHPSLKQLMAPIFENDLFSHDVSEIVTNTSSRLSELYKSQAHAREINLFYLAGGIRERIEKQGSEFIVCNTPIRFNEVELRKELQQHPERFSPNVILRGLYQETILPNVTFIGGGGELAYWLQLKEVFQNFSVPFPLLVLRNSFLIIENKWVERLKNIGLTKADLFRDVENLMNEWVQQKSNQQLSLNGKFELANSLFQSIQEQAVSIDPTLVQHVLALKKQAVQKLKELEKKMLRAEKRKFADTQNQLNSIKQALFPKGGLQERVENIGYYYSKWGSGFIDELYDHSLGLEHEFTIIEELKN
jgi:bacillithiol biosynthesis cysteine-adding enzyme BshC